MVTTTKTSTRDIALSLARHDLAVFPCVESWDEQRQKTIIKPKYAGYPESATRDPEEIINNGWFDDGEHIGILTGKSLDNGIIVVDIDDKIDSPHNGFDSIDQAGADLPDTFSYPSRSGRGEHRWYLAPEGVEVTQGANVLGPDGEKMQAVDLKAGSAGYVLWPGGELLERPTLTQAPSWAIKKKRHRASTEISIEDWVNGGLLTGCDPKAPLTKARKDYLKDKFPLDGIGNGDLYGKAKPVVETLLSGHGRYTEYTYALDRYTRHYPTSAPDFQRVWARCIGEVEAEIDQVMNAPATQYVPKEKHTEKVSPHDSDNDSPFTNVAALLQGTFTRAVASIGLRTDGKHLLYRGKVNVLVGDPESGKTLVCACIATEVLNNGGNVMWIDLDHNGSMEILNKLMGFGVPEEVLKDTNRFQIASEGVDEEKDVLKVVDVAVAWKPDLVVIDSVGELLPLFGASSDSSDDYTRVNRLVAGRMASAGSCVALVDHMSKGSDSRAFGATGTMAKKRAVNGAQYEVKNVTPFTPSGHGLADLFILKDREGDIRDNTPNPSGVRRPRAATFSLDGTGDKPVWSFKAPDTNQKAPRRAMPEITVNGMSSDLRELLKMKPIPRTKRDIRETMKWADRRALIALRELNAYTEAETEEKDIDNE